MAAPAAAPGAGPDVPPPARRVTLSELGIGNEASHAEAVQYLEAHPAVRDQLGDLARQARAALASALAPKNAAQRYSVEHAARKLAADVAGDAPTPLERLLAERIATAWLELHMLDLVVARETQPGLGPLTPDALEAADHRRGRAHKRYLAAIHELALVRRLLVPPVRVHIDQRRQGERLRALPARTT